MGSEVTDIILRRLQIRLPTSYVCPLRRVQPKLAKAFNPREETSPEAVRTVPPHRRSHHQSTFPGSRLAILPTRPISSIVPKRSSTVVCETSSYRVPHKPTIATIRAPQKHSAFAVKPRTISCVKLTGRRQRSSTKNGTNKEAQMPRNSILTFMVSLFFPLSPEPLGNLA